MALLYGRSRRFDPRSGQGFIAQLEQHLKTTGGKIASGRYYGRDKRWERIKEAYDLLVNGVGEAATDMCAAMQNRTTTALPANLLNQLCTLMLPGKIPLAVIGEGDVVVFSTTVTTALKELTIVLTRDMPEFGMKTIPNLHYFCMTFHTIRRLKAFISYSTKKT